MGWVAAGFSPRAAGFENPGFKPGWPPGSAGARSWPAQDLTLPSQGVPGSSFSPGRLLCVCVCVCVCVLCGGPLPWFEGRRIDELHLV